MNRANEIVAEIKKMQRYAHSRAAVTANSPSAFVSLERTFDTINGGFGGAPSFHRRCRSSSCFGIINGRTSGPSRRQRTADKMAMGGIYDQLGGGFHRYAVDAVWLVPHFEKMLYDNAQLARFPASFSGH